MNDLQLRIIELLHSFRGIDVLTLNERHIESDDEHSAIYDIPGYSFVSRPRNAGKGGGVGVYISNDITWDRQEDIEVDEIESIWIEIWPSRQHCKGILIATIYRPPDSFKYLHKDFNTAFNSMMTKASGESKEMIVFGGMNANFLSPGDNKDLKSVFELFGFKQLIEKPTILTETTRTLIDAVLTNTPENIADTDVIATSRSNTRLITCRDYKSYNAENMKCDLKKVDWTPFYSQRNVNDALAKMKNILSDLFGRHAPKISKKVRGKPALWLNNEVKALMNDRDKLLRRSRRTRKESDISAYKQKRNEVNIAVKRTKSDYHKKLLKKSSKDPNSGIH
eukprot:gene10725-19504_t